MSVYIEHESYKHKMAKQVIKKWFEDSENNDYMSIGDIRFRSNRKSGIFLEYPICNDIWYVSGPNPFTSIEDFEKHSISCNNNDCYCKECKIYNDGNSWETNWDEIEGSWDEYVPTYEQCINIYKTYPISIIDVVLSHKGSPYYAIEICHKNPVSSEKINKLKKNGINNLIEIDADWILNQTKPPTQLKYKRLI